MNHSIPDRPWFKIAANLLEFQEEHYLVLVDYYSNWIEFDETKRQLKPLPCYSNSSHDGDFPMRLSLTAQRISTLRNSHNSVRGSR